MSAQDLRAAAAPRDAHRRPPYLGRLALERSRPPYVSVRSANARSCAGLHANARRQTQGQPSNMRSAESVRAHELP